ncbi:portal protein [Shumkonia mesophila]|uniref:portal protein n=1 Tax=Shumkonia mesophila TaxID=2838854 RepID=UPI002934AE6D|nr:portal protein [Shumkonia mesophila]
MSEIDPKALIERFRRAKDRRAVWEAHWQECYDFALPQRGGGLMQTMTPGAKRTDKLFDGTAPDAVDQLAASLLAQLTPPWARWFGFDVGKDVAPEDQDMLAAELERAETILQSHFDRANFAVEMHQCFLDLVTAGTASLMFEEAPPGEPSAFRFTAVPLAQVVLEEGAAGRLDTSFRRSELTHAQLRDRFAEAPIPGAVAERLERDAEARATVIEAVVPEKGGYTYLAVLETDPAPVGEPAVLARGRFHQSPFINFRWLKAPGEAYGRSPVMKALPDIKTANKVVELVLKNASIAVTGIWQADDDGVLNPATIKLVPGTIIPKAVGSSGLTPLEAPGRFDVSELVLDQLRGRIRSALLVDKLGPVESPRMTATEVLERAAEMARVLGATYGRLQSELLTPLVQRGLAILVRRGEVADLRVDGRLVDLSYKSPLARNQAQQDAQNTLMWLDAVRALGPEALPAIDQPKTVRWLARAFGVPAELLRPEGEVAAAGGAMPDAASLMALFGQGAAAAGGSVLPAAGPADPVTMAQGGQDVPS